MRSLRLSSFVSLWLMALTLSGAALATPIARILRVDPLASQGGGAPLVTLLIDLTEPRRLSEVTGACVGLTGGPALTCESDALEKPFALHTPVPFPDQHVRLTIKIGERQVGAKLMRSARFGDSQNEEGVGTAWLIILDADDRGKGGFLELKRVAEGFLGALGPADWANVVILGERGAIADSAWASAANKSELLAMLERQKTPEKSRDRTRPLLTQLRSALEDALLTLRPETGKRLPLLQAIVFLSSGYGGGDPASTGPGALEFSRRLTLGELGEQGGALPKMPTPIISIMTPPSGYPEHAQLARDFMRNLANPEIGGFFSVIQGGQSAHAGRIVDAVRSRFAQFTLAKFRLACVASSPFQSFSLLFPTSDPPIVGDASFQNFPLGVDPSAWPLDVDVAMTRAEIDKAGGLFPGGTFKVFGDFCWGGDTTRPEVYFLPPGEVLPETVSSSGAASADEVRRRLIALDMRSAAQSANDSFAEFRVPESDRILHGAGERQASRFVVVDRLDHRTSGLTAGSVIEVRSHKRPVPLVWSLVGWGSAALALAVALYSLFRLVRQRHTALATYSGIRVETSPYVAPAPVTRSERRSSVGPLRATLRSSSARFTVLPNLELSVGRDGSRAAAVLENPQVSGLHATFRLHNGVLEVRDETSSLGTRVDGERIAPGQFVELKNGQEVALGPEVFRVELAGGT